MVWLRTREKYSVHLMLAIACLGEEGTPIRLGEISDCTGISRRYLEQLVIPLKNAGLIRGRSGRAGGYMLSKDAGEINIREIIEAAAGPVAATDCAAGDTGCGNTVSCRCRPLWIDITRSIHGVLDRSTLAELAAPLPGTAGAAAAAGAGTAAATPAEDGEAAATPEGGAATAAESGTTVGRHYPAACCRNE